MPSEGIFECPVCRENLYYQQDRHMLYAETCGHGMCDRCFSLQVCQLGVGCCPVCKQVISRNVYKPRSFDSNQFALEKEIRSKVLAVYNKSRQDLPNTPEYNDYLENIEDIVYELSHGNDEGKKRLLEGQLKQQERENAKNIAERNDVQKAAAMKKIRDIVEKEKTFYEAVKLSLSFNQRDAHRMSGASALVHPLQRQYAASFKEKDTGMAPTMAADGLPRPLNAAIREESNITKRILNTSKEREDAAVAAGYSSEAVNARNLQELQLQIWFAGLRRNAVI